MEDPTPTAESYLRNCPDRLKARHRKKAERAAAGQRAPAIRLKCLDCVCWNPGEVKRCPLTDCPLWPFRLGGV